MYCIKRLAKVKVRLIATKYTLRDSQYQKLSSNQTMHEQGQLSSQKAGQQQANILYK